MNPQLQFENLIRTIYEILSKKQILLTKISNRKCLQKIWFNKLLLNQIIELEFLRHRKFNKKYYSMICLVSFLLLKYILYCNSTKLFFFSFGFYAIC